MPSSPSQPSSGAELLWGKNGLTAHLGDVELKKA